MSEQPRSFSGTHPHLREFSAFLEDFNRDTERGLALAAAAMLDDLLGRVLGSFMIQNKGGLDLLEGAFHSSPFVCPSRLERSGISAISGYRRPWVGCRAAASILAQVCASVGSTPSSDKVMVTPGACRVQEEVILREWTVLIGASGEDLTNVA